MRPRLPLIGLAVGAWAVLPPYAGPGVNASHRAEFADHVVPAIVVVVISLGALAFARHDAGGVLMFFGGLVITVFGLWMAATHVTLVGDAADHRVSLAALLNHSLPGLAVVSLGGLWAWCYWSAS